MFSFGDEVYSTQKDRRGKYLGVAWASKASHWIWTCGMPEIWNTSEIIMMSEHKQMESLSLAVASNTTEI